MKPREEIVIEMPSLPALGPCRDFLISVLCARRPFRLLVPRQDGCVLRDLSRLAKSARMRLREQSISGDSGAASTASKP